MIAARKGPPRCYLCQERPGTTKDHIPPMGMISNKQASQLITVPCCEDCRTKNQLDDEYFRNVMVMSADPRATGPVYEAMLRSFQRRPALKATMLRRSWKLDDRRVFVARDETMTRVLVRIARGLAFRKAKTLIPAEYESEVLWNPIDIGVDLLTRSQIQGAIGVDFTYAGLLAAEDPAVSFWWMAFYKGNGAIITFDAPAADLTNGEGSGSAVPVKE